MARVVNPESVWTRRIRTFDREGRSLLDASGFVIEADGDHYLISNRHVLAGLTTANEYVRGRELPVEAEVTFVGNDAGRTPTLRGSNFSTPRTTPCGCSTRHTASTSTSSRCHCRQTCPSATYPSDPSVTGSSARKACHIEFRCSSTWPTPSL